MSSKPEQPPRQEPPKPHKERSGTGPPRREPFSGKATIGGDPPNKEPKRPG